MTGLYNRRKVGETLQRDLERTVNTSSNLSVVIIGIDLLQQFNEIYGHLAGDDCIKDISRIIEDVMPDDGLAGRYGGKEFICILPGEDVDKTLEIKDEITNRVKHLTIHHDALSYGSLTIS